MDLKPFRSSRCVSTAEPGHQELPASDGQSAPLAEPAEPDANTDRPPSRRAAAPDRADRRLDEGDVRC